MNKTDSTLKTKKVIREDLVKLNPNRERALEGLAMMKKLEKEKGRKMKTILMDDGKTLISATKDRLAEIIASYNNRKF